MKNIQKREANLHSNDTQYDNKSTKEPKLLSKSEVKLPIRYYGSKTFFTRYEQNQPEEPRRQGCK